MDASFGADWSGNAVNKVKNDSDISLNSAEA